RARRSRKVAMRKRIQKGEGRRQKKEKLFVPARRLLHEAEAVGLDAPVGGVADVEGEPEGGLHVEAPGAAAGDAVALLPVLQVRAMFHDAPRQVARAVGTLVPGEGADRF